MNDTRQTPETLNAERQQQARDYARSNLAMMKDDSPEAPAAVRRRAFQNEACDPEFLIVAEPAGGQ